MRSLRIRRSPAPAASVTNAAASTEALYAGLVVRSTMNRQAADHAATARALIVAVSALLGQGGRQRLLVGRRDVAPAQCLGVLELLLVEADLGRRPRAGALDEERPVGLVLGKAFGELRGLVVDRAHAEAKAERLRLVWDAGLVHQRLAVDGVSCEPDTSLQGRARHVLHHDVGVMG